MVLPDQHLGFYWGMRSCDGIRFWEFQGLVQHWILLEWHPQLQRGRILLQLDQGIHPKLRWRCLLGQLRPCLLQKGQNLLQGIPKRQGSLRLPRPILETKVKGGNSDSGLIQFSYCSHDVDLASPVSHLSAHQDHRRRSHLPKHPQPQAQPDGSSRKAWAGHKIHPSKRDHSQHCLRSCQPSRAMEVLLRFGTGQVCWRSHLLHAVLLWWAQYRADCRLQVHRGVRVPTGMYKGREGSDPPVLPQHLERPERCSSAQRKELSLRDCVRGPRIPEHEVEQSPVRGARGQRTQAHHGDFKLGLRNHQWAVHR